MSDKRKKQIILIEVAVVFALLIILAAVLMAGGRKEAEPVVDAVEEPEIPMEEENPVNTGEEDGEEQEEPVSTVKEVGTETMDTTVGIDVSEYQGNIRWQEASQGLDFVMVRLGYRRAGSGEIEEDACARYNLQEAAANGMYLGAYFFSTAVSEEEAREEARWACDLLAGYPVTYPVAYNCEGFQEESSRQHGLTVEERSQIARAFLDEVEAQGYTGMFYASRNELEGSSLWDTRGLESGYRMWVAQYSAPSYPEVEKLSYTGKCAMWQYTNQGSVPGISAPVDLNVAYFGYSKAASAKVEGAAAPVAANPEVGVEFEEVKEQVTAKEEANLRRAMDQGDDSNVVAKLMNGETALRTGKGNNGWSRVEYNGQVLYAVSSILTTDLSYKPPVKEPESEFKTKFTTVSENVTAKEVTNLRNRPSIEAPSEVIVKLTNGEVIVRTGVSDMGWSRVEYNGQTLYCISSYLQVVE